MAAKFKNWRAGVYHVGYLKFTARFNEWVFDGGRRMARMRCLAGENLPC